MPFFGIESFDKFFNAIKFILLIISVAGTVIFDDYIFCFLVRTHKIINAAQINRSYLIFYFTLINSRLSG